MRHRKWLTWYHCDLWQGWSEMTNAHLCMSVIVLLVLLTQTRSVGDHEHIQWTLHPFCSTFWDAEGENSTRTRFPHTWMIITLDYLRIPRIQKGANGARPSWHSSRREIIYVENAKPESTSTLWTNQNLYRAKTWPWCHFLRQKLLQNTDSPLFRLECSAGSTSGLAPPAGSLEVTYLLFIWTSRYHIDCTRPRDPQDASSGSYHWHQHLGLGCSLEWTHNAWCWAWACQTTKLRSGPSTHGSVRSYV